jgi:8-oxo-dGTP diphosphatase
MHSSQYKYDRHFLAVDCVIFGYEKDTLKLLISHRRFQPAQGDWSLLGGWVGEEETVEEAASRVLQQITGLKDIYLDQVSVFSDPQRDSGGRVISVVFYAMIRIDKYDRDLVQEHGAVWCPLGEMPDLIFDHNVMVAAAHKKLKQKASYELIGDNLLPSHFTFLQLRTLYEAIFQRKFDPGNFRKKVQSLRQLERLNDKNTTDSKKGAYYFRFRKQKDSFIKQRVVKL